MNVPGTSGSGSSGSGKRQRNASLGSYPTGHNANVTPNISPSKAHIHNLITLSELFFDYSYLQRSLIKHSLRLDLSPFRARCPFLPRPFTLLASTQQALTTRTQILQDQEDNPGLSKCVLFIISRLVYLSSTGAFFARFRAITLSPSS